MTVDDSRLRALTGWHLPATVFFAAGLSAGLAFAIVGPIPAIRTLGGLAAASAVLGIATVAYAARLENPHIFGALRAAAERLRAAMNVRGRELSVRVHYIERYLQNAVWSAMG